RSAGVEKREQETDRDRLNTLRNEFSHRRASSRLIEWNQHVPRRDDPLLHANAPPARHERMRLPRQVELQTEGLRPLVTGDVEDVAKALGGDKAGLGAAVRSEEHTSELQSRGHLVCRLLLE